MMSKKNLKSTKTGKEVNYDELLFDMVSKYPVKRTPSEMLVQVKQNGIQKNIPIQSEEFSSYILKTFRDTYGAFAPAHSIKNCINYKKAEAYEQKITNTEKRIAITNDNSILYDLCNGTCVKVTQNGWGFIKNDGLTFSENPLQSEQVVPIRCDRGWERLWKYLNLSEGEKLLYTVYLVACFYPKLVYPSITINGPQRSGKSTLSKILKRIIDPSVAEAEIFPESLDDLKVTLNKSYYVSFDNMSSLSKKHSDFLCSVVTGTAVVSRKKFCDDAAFIISLKKGFCLNGITQYVKRDDLAERMLFLNTQTISTTDIKEETLWENFEKDLPYIMGGIFDLLSKGIRDYSNIDRTSPIRWGDFYRFAYCTVENMGMRGIELDEILKETQSVQEETNYENNPLLKLVVDFVDECEGTWESSPEQLHKFLINFMKDKLEHKHYYNVLPKSANQMSRKLFELQTSLLSVGIKIEKDKNVNGRIIRFSLLESEEKKVDEDTEGIKREPIVGLRKPIFLTENTKEYVRKYIDAFVRD